MSSSQSHAVSLFSNCGAGDVGYRKAGFRFDVMAELDPRRLEVCLLNHQGAIGIPDDLRNTWPIVIDNYRTIAGAVAPQLLAACPPCQRYSSARGRRGHQEDGIAGSQEKLLVTVIAEVAKSLRPLVTVVENVPAFLTSKVCDPETNEEVCPARLLIDLLTPDYVVFPILVDLCEFGVPQSRSRAFLTFIRSDLPALRYLLDNELSPYPIPSHAKDFGGEPVTLLEALQTFALPSLDAASETEATSADGNAMHRVPVWNETRYSMIKAIPPNSGRSAWQNDECLSCGNIASKATDALCQSCGAVLPRPIVKAKNGRYRLIRGFKSSSYTRMKPEEPAPTITTASGHLGSHRTIHPTENRVFSPQECANLQTFPPRFNWGDALAKWGHTNIRSMIGEAVPPLFTKQHGEVLQKLLSGIHPRRLLAHSDRRCKTARKKLGLTGKDVGKNDSMARRR
jgi:DNA (cytosine-5)-methyltransferase 1